jgi:hypothetical protein
MNEVIATIKPTDATILHHTNKPPIAITVVEKDHGVSLCSICLAVDGCDKVVKRIDELEVDIL